MTHQNDRDAWLAERRKYVTASDVGALMGVSEYKTREQLRMEKAGLANDFEGNEMTDLALDLEPFVIEQAKKKFGWSTLEPHGALTVDPRCPYLAATPDATMQTPWGIANVQIKVTMVKPYETVKKYSGMPPLWYLYQVQAELACLDLQLGCLLVLHTAPLALRAYPIKRNDLLIQKIRKEAASLMREVEALKKGAITV